MKEFNFFFIKYGSRYLEIIKVFGPALEHKYNESDNKIAVQYAWHNFKSNQIIGIYYIKLSYVMSNHNQ